MRKVKALYLHWPPAHRYWRDALFEAIGSRHALTEYDPETPLQAQLSDIEVLLDHGGRCATGEIIAAASHLRLWQMITVGYDTVDLDITADRDIMISNCPGSTSARGLAETAMMFMLTLVKQYRRAQCLVARGELSTLLTDELEHKRLAIIGFGASGSCLARLAAAFGMRLLIVEPREISARELEGLSPDVVAKPDDLDSVLAEADFVSLHLPLGPETAGIIDSRRIGLMKPTARLINVARAGLVNEEALNQALIEGQIAGIGSDVFADRLPGRESAAFEHKDLVALPHVAGGSEGTIRRRSEVCLENLDRIAQGLEPKHRVR